MPTQYILTYTRRPLIHTPSTGDTAYTVTCNGQDIGQVRSFGYMGQRWWHFTLDAEGPCFADALERSRHKAVMRVLKKLEAEAAWWTQLMEPTDASR